MGFFSWKTADSEETVWNRYSGMPCRPVYLLQPDGAAPIAEPNYDGYGEFGDTDAYIWLARHNIDAKILETLDSEQIRNAGVGLDCGHYYVDIETGDRMSLCHDHRDIDPTLEHHAMTFDKIVPGYDMSANDLIKQGRLISQDFSDKMTVPLKFSFDPNAVYEHLPPSASCESQGFFSNIDDDGEPEDNNDFDIAA